MASLWMFLLRKRHIYINHVFIIEKVNEVSIFQSVVNEYRKGNSEMVTNGKYEIYVRHWHIGLQAQESRVCRRASRTDMAVIRQQGPTKHK
jgi:hypothetical protein